MKKCRIIILLALIALNVTVCFTSCKNGMQDLINELDVSLTVTAPGLLDITSSEFDPSSMLQDKYFVGNDAMLCLTAPKAISYLWQIYRINYNVLQVGDYTFEQEVFEEIVVGNRIPITKKILNLYIPDVETAMTPGTYKLMLTVKDDYGNEYTDVAQLVIYKPCHNL